MCIRDRSTITDYARTLRRLTKFLQQEQVESFRMLKPEYITPFIASVASYHGQMCIRDSSYICDKKASLYINDKDLFILFCKTDAYIRAFEMEYALSLIHI